MAQSSTSRPTSPTMQHLLPFRFMGGEKDVLGEGPGITRRSSNMINSKGKGKERAIDDPPPSPSASSYPFISRPQSASGFSYMSSGTASAPTSPSRPSTSHIKRNSTVSTHSTSSRGSIFDLAASASPFKFGRKRKSLISSRGSSMRMPGMNIILPDVLEISAATVATNATGDSGIGEKEIDEETRERDRLREEAAQALGLGTGNVHSHSRVDIQSLHDDDGLEGDALSPSQREDDLEYSHHDQESSSMSGQTSESAAPTHHAHFSHPPQSPTFTTYANQPRTPLTSTASLAPPALSVGVGIAHGRNRSGSMPAAFTFHTPSQTTPTLPPALSHSLGQNGPSAQSHARASSISMAPGAPIGTSAFNTGSSSSSVPDAPTPLSITPVPSFPSTPAALKPFTQISSSGTLPKYYPSSSLRIFALGKQWKGRHLILSSPIIGLTEEHVNGITHTVAGSISHVSYLHLFKSASPDEHELERLEINEDSAVFVAEEDVGGRKSVVKVRGIEIGSDNVQKKEGGGRKEKDWDGRGGTGEGGCENDGPMWFVQIVDPAEKQRWIESVKNKIFAQRTMRAGLGSSSPIASSGLIEPRGDMDVMMSMRAQGIIGSSIIPTSPVRKTFGAQDSTNYLITANTPGSPTTPSTPTAASITSHGQHGPQYAASMSSVRSYDTSQADAHNKHNSSLPSTYGLGSALKGLFTHKTSGRPRSSSRATSITDIEAGDDSRPKEAGGMQRVNSDSSVNALGHASVKATKSRSKTGNLMSILRSSTTESLAGMVNSGSSGGLTGKSSSFGADSSVYDGLSMGIHIPAVDFRSFAVARPHPHQLERKIIEDPATTDQGADDGLLTARPSLINEGTLSSNSSSTIVHVSSPSGASTRSMRAFSVGDAFSLQPPPRKRWTTAPGPGTPPLQDSPFAKDHHALSDMGVLGGGNPSIFTTPSDTVNGNFSPKINTPENGKLSPEPLAGSSPLTARRASASGGSAFSFSIGTPPGSGYALAGQEREFRPGSRSSKSVRSGRSVLSRRSVSTTEDGDEEIGDDDAREAGGIQSAQVTGSGKESNGGTNEYGNVLLSDEGERGASVSSAKRSSGATRWSRQLPKRLTPPSGPPPAVPSTPSSSRGREGERTSLSPSKLLGSQGQPHPYSGTSLSDSRYISTPTNNSTSPRSSSSRRSSRSSVVSNLPSFSKRASASSAISTFSVNTGSTSQSNGNAASVSAPAGILPPLSGVTGHPRSTSSAHRASVSPPPRPAPTFALPPAPADAVSSTPTAPVSAPAPTSSRSSFRDSVAGRALRLSLMAPKPPPTIVLPPRPDETEQRQTLPQSPKSTSSGTSKTHRRSQSGSSHRDSVSGTLYSIPGSPVPPSPVHSGTPLHSSTSPFPPPVGPLPPTPTSSSGNRSSLPPSRGVSIKQRLRILSAPSSTSSASTLSQSLRSSSRPTTMTTPLLPSATTASPPGTPVQANTPYIEKSSFLQDCNNINRLTINVNEPGSFLSLATPITPSLPTPKIHTLPPPEPEPELTSLSPPPRRGSKRISLPEVESEVASVVIQEPPSLLPSTNEDDDHNKTFSLSRHGSDVSLGLALST